MKRYRAWITIAAALALIILAAPQKAEAAEPDTSWFNYLEPQKTYEISNEEELRGLASLVNEEQYLWKPDRTEHFEDATFRLTCDIELTEPWTPIGRDEQLNFQGVFDGQGHTISGIVLDTPDSNAGFFAYLSGEVKDLTLQGEITSAADNCGGIAGVLDENGKIKNCKSFINVTGTSKVGGLAGLNEKGVLMDSINYGDVYATTMVGGLVGENWGGTVFRCGNRGSITSVGSGSFNNSTGGIAGRSVSAAIIDRSYNVGNIKSSNEATGGVAGYLNGSGSAILSCYNIGSIAIEQPLEKTEVAPAIRGIDSDSGKLPVYAGGITGYAGSQFVEIRNCYNTGLIRGADVTGGIIGKLENEMYTDAQPKFSNNYYAESLFDDGIGADRNDDPIHFRGAATEIYPSAFNHLAASLGSDYMDDRDGDYGSKGYPVLIWQDMIQPDTAVQLLEHVDPEVLERLNQCRDIKIRSKGQGQTMLRFFNTDSVYDHENLQQIKRQVEESDKE